MPLLGEPAQTPRKWTRLEGCRGRSGIVVKKSVAGDPGIGSKNPLKTNDDQKIRNNSMITIGSIGSTSFDSILIFHDGFDSIMILRLKMQQHEATPGFLRIPFHPVSCGFVVPLEPGDLSCVDPHMLRKGSFLPQMRSLNEF